LLHITFGMTYVYLEVVLVWNLIIFVDSTFVSGTHLLINMRE